MHAAMQEYYVLHCAALQQTSKSFYMHFQSQLASSPGLFWPGDKAKSQHDTSKNNVKQVLGMKITGSIMQYHAEFMHEV